MPRAAYIEVKTSNDQIQLKMVPLDRPDMVQLWHLTQDEARELRDELTRRITPTRM